MDMNSMLLQEHRDAYIAARMESRRRYHCGTGSPVVAMIGTLAGLLGRIATRIETWSHGSSDAVIHRQAPVR